MVAQDQARLMRYWRNKTSTTRYWQNLFISWGSIWIKVFINGREKVWIKKLKNPKAFINYSQTIDNACGNLEDYNPTNKRKVLIKFDGMTADMEANKSHSHCIVLKRKKTQHFACFYIKILFEST